MRAIPLVCSIWGIWGIHFKIKIIRLGTRQNIRTHSQRCVAVIIKAIIRHVEFKKRKPSLPVKATRKLRHCVVLVGLDWAELEISSVALNAHIASNNDALSTRHLLPLHCKRADSGYIEVFSVVANQFCIVMSISAAIWLRACTSASLADSRCSLGFWILWVGTGA